MVVRLSVAFQFDASGAELGDLWEHRAVDVVLVGDGVLGRVVLAFHVVIVTLGTFKFADVGRVPRIVEVVQLLALLVKLLQIATELQLVDRLQVVITGPRAAELAWVWNAGGRA